MKTVIGYMSSKSALIWLVTGWVFYYVTSAVWTEEAFATFITQLGKNPLVQAGYVLFLICLALNIMRSFRSRLQNGAVSAGAWVVLPAGILIFLSGYFMSSAFRQWDYVIAGEGGAIRPAWSKTDYSVVDMVSPLKDEALDTGDGSFFSMEPKVTVTDGKIKVTVGVFPPKKISGTYFHILNFGLAPGIRLLDDKGEVEAEGYMALKLLPPGAEDKFELPPLPYKFAIRLAPSRVIEKGGTVGKIFSLKSPDYEAVVFRGKEVVFEGNSKEGIIFDGRRLEFTEPSHWAYLEVVKDPGAAVIVWGLWIIAIGICLRIIALTVKVIRR